ncbi:MAG: diguanylate cyclase [Defluviitaleaceae bacterium]|nr:diguanylate cyclase [Defluviitaleaceae bacterium]
MKNTKPYGNIDGVSELCDSCLQDEFVHLTGRTLKFVVDNMSLAYVFLDNDVRLLKCNQATIDLFGIDKDKLDKTQLFLDFSPEYQPDGGLSREKANKLIAQVHNEGKITFEWIHINVSGEEIPTETVLTRVKWQDGFGLVAFIRDMREINKIQETERSTIQRLMARLMAMLDSSPLACTIVDENLNVLDVTQEMANLLGLPDKKVYLERQMELSPQYQPDGKLSYDKMIEKLKSAFITGKEHFEWMYNTLDGTMVPCEVFLTRVELDGHNFITVYRRDLRELKSTMDLMEKLEELAFSDALTKLSTRHYFLDAAEQELRKCIDEGQSFHLLMIDIDFFKRINDTYGHPVGDEVLKILSARMRRATKRNTLIARYGGEEFIVMLSRMDINIAEKIAWRIQQSAEVYKFGTEVHKIPVTVSIGLASCKGQGDTLADIIKRADYAMYEAKASGRNTVKLSVNCDK